MSPGALTGGLPAASGAWDLFRVREALGSSSAPSPNDRQPYVAVEGLSDVMPGVGKVCSREIPAASSMLVPGTPGGCPPG